MSKLELTLGTDPEFCVFSRKEGRIVSAIPLMDGYDKDRRLKLNNGVEVFPDNVNIEATVQPSFSKEEFVNNIHVLSNELDGFLDTLDCETRIVAAHNYCMERDLNTDRAFHFGCRPELVVYPGDDGRFIEYERDPDTIGTLRVCGGHLHIGRKDWQTAAEDAWLIEPWSKVKTARALDWLLATVVTYLTKDPSSTERKKLYGRAGSMRYDLPYGFEYRTLDNFWLSSREMVGLVYDIVEFSVYFAESNPTLFEASNDTVDFAKIQEAINTGNKELCYELFIASPLPDSIKTRINELEQTLVFTPSFKHD